MTTRRERSALRGRALCDPSDLSVLTALAAHRVLTTHQLVRVLRRSPRTVEWRMGRLRAARLVAGVRPPLRSGTAPFHWWLTAAGRRATGHAARRDPETPNPLFLLHTAAVAGLALALGDAPGRRLVDWRREEAAWERWEVEEASMWAPARAKTWTLRPDATAAVEVAGLEAHAFVEVDRGTMSHTRLRSKAVAYLRYAADRGWRGRHPFCPPLLFLTTSPERARSFLEGVAAVRAGSDGGWGRGWRAEEMAVVATACVDDAEAAVGAAVWQDERGGKPRTLVDFLASVAVERTEALAAERAEKEAADAEETAARRLRAWRELATATPRDLPWDDTRADAVRLLADESTDWRARDPELADALADWWSSRAAGWDREPMAEATAVALRRFTEERRREQAAALLSGRRLDLPPDLAALRLAAGRLVVPDHGLERREAQRAETMAGHAARRQRWVESELGNIGPLRRLRARADELAAAYDGEHLIVCTDCGAERPRDHRRPPCPRCGCERVLLWHERRRVPTTEERIASLRGVAEGRRP